MRENRLNFITPLSRRRRELGAIAMLGLGLCAMAARRAEAQQAATESPATQARSRLAIPPTDSPTTTTAPAPYVDPWQGVGYEDMALLMKTARRSLEAKLTADSEVAPGYVPPALRDKNGIICLRLRSGGLLICEAASGRKPIVEAANIAGAALAQAIIKNNVKCDDGGRSFGLELEWLGSTEVLVSRLAEGGHWSEELLHSFEPAVEGIEVEFHGKQAWTCPSEIVTRNYSPDLAIAAAESKVGLQFIHKVRMQREITYSRFPSLHLWQPGTDQLPVRLHRGEKLVDQAVVNARGLDEAIARMRKYLRYLQMADGGFAEEYSPSADRFDHGPTPRLQMHALSSLVVLHQWTGQASDLERLRRCLDRAVIAAKPIQRAEKDDKGEIRIEEAGLAIQFPGETDCLEPTARLLLAMLSADPDARNNKIAQGLAKAIRASQGEDGRLELKLDDGAAAQPESIVAGAWGMRALMAWDGSARDDAITAILERARVHYQSWYESSAEPWESTALARALMQLYARSNDARCSDLAFSILDRFAALQVTATACPMPELWGAINTGQPGVVGSDSAAYVSALAEGLELAGRIGDRQRVKRYESAVRLGARFILQLEFSEAGCFYVRTPRDALGGVRRSPWDNRIRVDRCGGALEALIRTRAALFGDTPRRSNKQP